METEREKPAVRWEGCLRLSAGPAVVVAQFLKGADSGERLVLGRPAWGGTAARTGPGALLLCYDTRAAQRGAEAVPGDDGAVPDAGRTGRVQPAGVGRGVRRTAAGTGDPGGGILSAGCLWIRDRGGPHRGGIRALRCGTGRTISQRCSRSAIPMTGRALPLGD